MFPVLWLDSLIRKLHDKLNFQHMSELNSRYSTFPIIIPFCTMSMCYFHNK